MKKIGIFAAFVLLFLVGVGFVATSPKSYKFGSKTSETLTSAVTIATTPVNTYTLYELALDTNATINLSTSHKMVVGDKVGFTITAEDMQRSLIWGTSYDLATMYVDTSATYFIEFIYNGTSLIPIANYVTESTFGLQRQYKTLTYGSTVTLLCHQSYTYATLAATGNCTLNRSTSSVNTKGDRLVVAIAATNADTVTWGTGFSYSTATPVPNGKTKIAEFVFNGSAFVPIATPVQIN